MNSKAQPKKTKTKDTIAKPSRLKTSRICKPGDLDLDEWQRTLRKEYGRQQNFNLKNTGDHPLFSEFLLTNPRSKNTYKILIRGNQPGDNYCSCPDYRITSLGTCKHIEFTLSELMKKSGVPKAFEQGYIPPFSEVCLHYGLKREIRFNAGRHAPDELLSLVVEFFDSGGILKEDRILDFH